MIQLSDGRTIEGIAIELGRRSFDFQGRSRRTDGIILYVLVVLLSLLANWLAWLIFDAFPESEAGFWFNEIALALSILPAIGWVVRRLHDLGQSGFWGIPLVYCVVVSVYGEGWSGAGAAISLGWVMAIAILAWPPTRDENRYGPNPRPSSKSTEDTMII